MDRILKGPFFGLTRDTLNQGQVFEFCRWLLPIEQQLEFCSSSVVGHLGRIIGNPINNGIKDGKLISLKKNLFSLLKGTESLAVNGKDTLLSDIWRLELQAKHSRVNLNIIPTAKPFTDLYDMVWLVSDTQLPGICMTIVSEMLMANILPLKHRVLEHTAIGDSFILPSDQFILERERALGQAEKIAVELFGEKHLLGHRNEYLDVWEKYLDFVAEQVQVAETHVTSKNG